jgi:hypothetical protein
LLGAWRGPQARLAEIIADVTVVVCVSEILGSVHLYRLAPVVIALAVVGLAAIWGAKRFASLGSENDAPPASAVPQRAPKVAGAVALLAVSVVIAEWSTRTVAAYHHGMFSVDTLWYHMPLAARFVQDGSITGLHYADSQPDTVFFPASSELFHSLGILLMGNDLLSPLLNSLWLGLALLASWCIGSPYGVAPITLTGSAILFATPEVVTLQPGGAYDDIVGLALLLSSVALLINSRALSDRSTRVAWAVAAAAAGVALGTKYTFVGPAIALTVGVCFLAPRGKRMRDVGIWLLFLLLAGGFWYGRNFVAVGNPIPSIHLKLGPISLPSAPVRGTSTVAHFLFDSYAWHRFFIPGLRVTYGPAWWALLGLSLIGLVLALVTGDRLQRVLGLVGLASGVFFLLTPQNLTIFGFPAFFSDNVRYNDPAVVMGLALLPINPMLSAWRRARWVLLAYGAILVATQFDGAIWPTSFFTQRLVPAVGGSDSLLGLLVGVIVLLLGAAIFLYKDAPRRWRTATAAYIFVGAIVLIAGFPLQQTYLRDRYTSTSGSAFAVLGSWFQHLNNVRVGVVGQYAYLQYPFYGKNLSNYVQYLGVRGPHGTFSTFSSCKAWREEITQGRYSYVFVTTEEFGTRSAVSLTVPEMKWMQAGGGAEILFRGVTRVGKPFPGYIGYTLYKVGPHFSSESCSTVT